MREDKAELRARVFLLEKERATIELKLGVQDTQIAAQYAAILHLQEQLRDMEAMPAVIANKVSSWEEFQTIRNSLVLFYLSFFLIILSVRLLGTSNER